MFRVMYLVFYKKYSSCLFFKKLMNIFEFIDRIFIVIRTFIV